MKDIANVNRGMQTANLAGYFRRMIWCAVMVCAAAFGPGAGQAAAQTNSFPSNGGVEIIDRGDSCCADFRLSSGGYESHFYSYGSGTFQIHKYGSSSVNGAAFTIANGGNVGIGTASPSSKLDVNGDITVNGNINAKYQDLAEWVPAAKDIAPGSIVVLDRSRSNSVVESTKPYDTRVAGVVSARPGIILGEAGDGKVKVATTGRVKVRIDATKGAVEIGDLLVTSDKEGVGMKSEPVKLGEVEIHRPGTLIGKALEPLAEGEGEILVLLSLQ